MFVRRAPRAAWSAGARGLAKKAAGKVELGWDALQAELLQVPVELPELKTLLLTHCRRGGAGHTGAQKFVKAHIAQLRYQNPDADVSARALQPGGAPAKPGDTSSVMIELTSGEKHEFEVKGLTTPQILQRVLRAAGMPESAVERAMEAALPPVAAAEEAAPPEEEAPFEDGGAADPGAAASDRGAAQASQ